MMIGKRQVILHKNIGFRIGVNLVDAKQLKNHGKVKPLIQIKIPAVKTYVLVVNLMNVNNR